VRSHPWRKRPAEGQGGNEEGATSVVFGVTRRRENLAENNLDNHAEGLGVPADRERADLQDTPRLQGGVAGSKSLGSMKPTIDLLPIIFLTFLKV